MSLILAEPNCQPRIAGQPTLASLLSLRKAPLAKFIWLDLLERTIVVSMFSVFAFRLISSHSLTSGLAVPLLLASEVLPIVLLICRKWSKSHAMSVNPLDWILAYAGANFSLMAVPGAPGTVIPPELCSLVILGGLLTQISAKMILWRSFGIVAAVREIKVIGPYRFIRHPMYAGYTIVHIGFLLAFPSLWNLVVYSGALLIQIARLLREEHLLNTDHHYRAFASRVRYRLLPGVF